MYVDSMAKCFAVLVLACLFALAAGCTKATAPVISEMGARTDEPGPSVHPDPEPTIQQKLLPQSGYHIIVKGDTLYSIAWRYNLDYLDLAAWNKIREPYIIYPKQVLRLKPMPIQIQAKPLEQKKPLVSEPDTPKKKIETIKLQGIPSPSIKWVWPTSGKIVELDTPTSKKGINITGKHGQTVKSSAAGEVVYSGSGLLGYGKLIIIKHNKTYLSAYAYNSQLLVEEGEKVSAGQRISKMGRAHGGRALLYFEIRKSGKPDNPLDYLPKRPS